MGTKIFGLKDWQILAILIGVAVITSTASAAINIAYDIETTSAWWLGWFQNLSTEMFGALLTFFVLELVVGTRRTKQKLIIQLHSLNNSIALQALEELRLQGALHDGSLRRMDIQNGNLNRADFSNANLQNTNLSRCRLINSDFSRADLRRARFIKANLKNADFSRANLKGADLRGANLENANLAHANLQGVDLRGARLDGASLWQVDFDENTILPNQRHWKPGINLARFGIQEKPAAW